MKAEVQDLLERQAQWQRSRASLPWGDKLRASIALRRSVLSLRRHGVGQPTDHAASPRSDCAGSGSLSISMIETDSDSDSDSDGLSPNGCSGVRASV